MKKRWLLAIISLLLILSLAACGEKSKEDVVKGLNEKVKDMSGYKVTAVMTLKAGPTAQKYNVDVWHKKPTDYRVALQNDVKSQNQMILRNQEGVFVITPALNKSYRFQSDWPLNASQAYLFESLVRDVMKDKSAKFKATKDSYVFETKTNYNNNQALPTQVITFDRGSMAPVSVQIKDADGNVVVDIQFKGMKFNAKFDKDAFETKRNMTSMSLSKKEMEASNQPLSVLYPLLSLKGVELIEEKEVSIQDGVRFILTYGGKKNYTLIEEKVAPSEKNTVVMTSGEPIDLGFTVGILNGKMLTWTVGGVEYTLASDDLSKAQMVSIAESVQGKAMK